MSGPSLGLGLGAPCSSASSTFPRLSDSGGAASSTWQHTTVLAVEDPGTFLPAGPGGSAAASAGTMVPSRLEMLTAAAPVTARATLSGHPVVVNRGSWSLAAPAARHSFGGVVRQVNVRTAATVAAPVAIATATATASPSTTSTTSATTTSATTSETAKVQARAAPACAGMATVATVATVTTIATMTPKGGCSVVSTEAAPRSQVSSPLRRPAVPRLPLAQLASPTGGFASERSTLRPPEVFMKEVGQIPLPSFKHSAPSPLPLPAPQPPVSCSPSSTAATVSSAPSDYNDLRERVAGSPDSFSPSRNPYSNSTNNSKSSSSTNDKGNDHRSSHDDSNDFAWANLTAELCNSDAEAEADVEVEVEAGDKEKDKGDEKERELATRDRNGREGREGEISREMEREREREEQRLGSSNLNNFSRGNRGASPRRLDGTTATAPSAPHPEDRAASEALVCSPSASALPASRLSACTPRGGGIQAIASESEADGRLFFDPPLRGGSSCSSSLGLDAGEDDTLLQQKQQEQQEQQQQQQDDQLRQMHELRQLQQLHELQQLQLQQAQQQQLRHMQQQMQQVQQKQQQQQQQQQQQPLPTFSHSPRKETPRRRASPQVRDLQVQAQAQAQAQARSSARARGRAGEGEEAARGLQPQPPQLPQSKQQQQPPAQQQQQQQLAHSNQSQQSPRSPRAQRKAVTYPATQCPPTRIVAQPLQQQQAQQPNEAGTCSSSPRSLRQIRTSRHETSRSPSSGSGTVTARSLEGFATRRSRAGSVGRSAAAKSRFSLVEPQDQQGSKAKTGPPLPVVWTRTEVLEPASDPTPRFVRNGPVRSEARSPSPALAAARDEQKAQVNAVKRSVCFSNALALKLEDLERHSSRAASPRGSKSPA